MEQLNILVIQFYLVHIGLRTCNTSRVIKVDERSFVGWGKIL